MTKQANAYLDIPRFAPAIAQISKSTFAYIQLPKMVFQNADALNRAQKLPQSSNWLNTPDLAPTAFVAPVTAISPN